MKYVEEFRDGRLAAQLARQLRRAVTRPWAVMEVCDDLIKYGAIIFSTLPILMFYPFLQRYFVKGIMIGAIKG